MITQCFPPNGTQTPPFFAAAEEIEFQPPSAAAIDQQNNSNNNNNSSPSAAHSASFFYNLSVLREKLHQVQSLASIFIPNDDHNHDQSHESAAALAMPTMGTMIQEIIVSASSMMFSCQQMALGPTDIENDPTHRPADPPAQTVGQTHPPSIFFPEDAGKLWFADQVYDNCDSTTTNDNNIRSSAKIDSSSPEKYDIVELEASDLLAKYTHYCQVCGKGFKRDANLRMHMRAHGDEYKSNAALSNPTKRAPEKTNNNKFPRKYSCPHEGCRWNKNHAKFQPLKSMICVKNHYKRSHCPKMYVCKRCNRKQFSVLSDLRTHEKHCGDLKWLCSCGTTFSRKDKLMGHVALFVGHVPAVRPDGHSLAGRAAVDVERR